MRDVIVIGAGGGGPVVAKELAARGLDVLVLEAGPRHDRPREQWSSYENDANNPLTGYLRWGPTDRSRPAWFREWAQNSFVWQLSGVGGTTQHFYGNYPRAYPGVFRGYDKPDRDAYDVEHRFPFTYGEMVPYFEWVEATAPVMTAAMGTKEQVFFRGCETLDLPVQTTKTTYGPSYRPQENAVLQPGGNAGRTSDPNLLTHPDATGCTFCGYCFQGCMRPVGAPRNQFAKRSTDNSYVPMALTADVWAPHGRPVELLTDAYVTRIHTESKNGVEVATGVTWRDNASGDEQREDARVVVMAGGCTENPRLWFNSGLPNPNDWVGRGYTDHFFDWVVGSFDEYTGNPKGVGSAARLDFPPYGGLENVGLPPALNGFATALSDSGIRGEYTNGRGPTGPWDGPAGRLMGPELKDLVAGGLDRLLSVLVITDDDVERDNRVVPSALPADENGPIPKISFPHRERTRRTTRNREFMARKAAELLRGAGARQVYRIDWAPLLLHVQSSMRMGESEHNSVLDSNAESRAVKRLFVADNSALANSLGGPNPTLTTQALATRTAEKIFQGYFGGDPWVASESPVVSTDPRISTRLGELGL
ncbi:GMC family oxidoreductase N-terminal domain-containing protein [Saccharomonospora iraqiensis]|uniref:GMC family oxidoreductase N-terminal domain-containing protein n=1 Tax=Saccharomonospora iraqiensis TaxID=52698 RepID=UPI00042A1917|nr:GMC family oxidoreductase N-terminal domain-containing protein [Saccharomonospora iraqiensis]